VIEKKSKRMTSIIYSIKMKKNTNVFGKKKCMVEGGRLSKQAGTDQEPPTLNSRTMTATPPTRLPLSSCGVANNNT
jgi:hypothetical protein